MTDKPVMIITGTRKGIGKYLAEYFAEKGFFVIGCSRSDIDFKLNNYQHYCLDISDESLVNKMFTMIRKKYGRLDVLINNAGVNYALSPLLLIPFESALKTININFMGTFLFTREAVKIMKQNCEKSGKQLFLIIQVVQIVLPQKLAASLDDFRGTIGEQRQMIESIVFFIGIATRLQRIEAPAQSTAPLSGTPPAPATGARQPLTD